MTWHKLKRLLLSLLIPLAIISLAIQPLLTGHMPWQGDGLLHYVRLAVLENGVRAGDFYPRWSPDLAYGYGFPLFNYYAPLSYYIGLPFRLAGMSLKAATNTSYILAMWVLAAGAYGWGKDTWNRAAGAVAALLLCYNPYILNNLLHRSALAELWGLAWLMATLWGIQRLFGELYKQKQLTTFALTILCYAALILSHNITALIGTPFILGYALYCCFVSETLDQPNQSQPHSPRPILLTFIPVALALTAFFWLPAFVEKELIQVERLVDGANFAYNNHFRSFNLLSGVSGLYTESLPANSAWLNPPLAQGFGFLSFFSLCFPVFALLIIFVKAKFREMWCPYGYLLKYLPVYMLAGVLPLFFAHTSSSFFWDHLPLLSFVQFPWRFIGLSAITTVLLLIKSVQFYTFVGNEVQKIVRKTTTYTPQQYRNSTILISVMLFLTLPHFGRDLTEGLNIYFWPTPPPPLPLLEGQATADLTTFELETGWLGTTAAGDYLPDTVRTLPQPEERPTHNTQAQSISLAQAEALTFDQFYFPSWQVSQNGIPVETRASDPFGFLQINLPAGTHQLTFQQLPTALQRVGNLISWLSLCGFVGVWGYVVYRRRKDLWADNRPHREFPITWRSWPTAVLLLVLVVPLSAASLKTAVFDHGDSILHIHDPKQTGRYSNSREINFDNQLIFLANDVLAYDDDNPLHPQTMRLFWYASNANQDYSVSLHIIDYDGYLYGQSDHLHPGNIPVSKWPEERFVSDDHTPTMKPGTPLGSYGIELIVYDANGRRLDVLNERGQPIGNSQNIGVLHLESVFSTDAIQANMANRLAQPPCSPFVCLLGYDVPLVDRRSVGERFPITLFLERSNDRTFPYSLPLRFVNQATSKTASLSIAVTNRAFNIYNSNGDRMADHIRRFEYAFYVPTTLDNGNPLPTGEYTLYFGDQPLHTLTITTPERNFTHQPLALPHSTPLGDLVLLDSADLNQDLTTLDPTQPLTASFLWHPQTSTDQSYKVFAQLLNSEQRVVAQSDRIPHNEDEPRPTTSWVADEYILDTHQLTLPADLDPTAEYTLIVGLYNEATGERLSALESDFVPIRP